MLPGEVLPVGMCGPLSCFFRIRVEIMEQELRRVYYDPELGVEACLFQGIDQGFPEHFHTY